MTNIFYYERAVIFAVDRHRDQKRWSGDPFVLHPLRVAQKLSGNTQKIVAILHDVVEDGVATINEVEGLFGPMVANAVDAITRRHEESYSDYIDRVAMNDIAKEVKLADLKDNLGDVPKTDEDRKRLESLRPRYEEAIEKLSR